MIEGGSMKIIIQIFAGGYEHLNYTSEEVINKLDTLPFNYDGIIIGWVKDSAFYEAIIEYAHQQGKWIHLWLPTFSELPTMSPVVSYNREPLPPFTFQEGESFEFSCPITENNSELFKIHFKKHYGHLDFDGVFLDKIRYPSFAHGLPGGFTCFCEMCIKKMTAESIDHQKVIAELNDTIKVDYCARRFESPVIQRFFEFKTNMLLKTLKELTLFFTALDYRVGYDVYIPEISFTVGQDMTTLLETGYVKPMYYRKTHAPAGVPFELKHLSNELTGDFPDNISDIEMEKELAGYRGDVYVGLDVNEIDNIATGDTAYFNRSLSTIKTSGASGVVLSWNMMQFKESTKKELKFI